MRRLRALSQRGTRAAAELPPGPLGVPARSWLMDRSAQFVARRTGRKQGPLPETSAIGAPEAPACRKARAIRILRFSARHPPSYPGRGTRRGKEPACLVRSAATHSVIPAKAGIQSRLLRARLPLDPGFRRDDEAGSFPAALAPDRASHYFPDTKRSSMQRLTGQNRIGTGAISRIPAASARALLDLKRLVLRRP